MYRELAPPSGLRHHVDCLWVRTPEPTRADEAPSVIVPDGCTDIMSIDRGLLVAGPDDRPMPFSGTAGAIVGIRFRPGRATALGAPLGELRNRRVALADLWGPRASALEDSLVGAGVDERLDALVRAVARRIGEDPSIDPIVGEVVRRLAEGERPAVGVLADDLGLSERQLRRRTIDALGYGPTTFARIVRFQRALHRVRSGDALADVAADTGYADQAHLTREVRALAGRSPGAMRRDAA